MRSEILLLQALGLMAWLPVCNARPILQEKTKEAAVSTTQISLTFLGQVAAKPPQHHYMFDIEVTAQPGRLRWLVFPGVLEEKMRSPSMIDITEGHQEHGVERIYFGGENHFNIVRIPASGKVHMPQWVFLTRLNQKQFDFEAWVVDEVMLPYGKTLAEVLGQKPSPLFTSTGAAPPGLTVTLPNPERIPIHIDVTKK
jgi:hypothetical protein